MQWVKRNWIWLMVVVTIGIIGSGIVVAVLVTEVQQKVAWYAAFVATAGLLFTAAKFVNDVLQLERERKKKEDEKKEKIKFLDLLQLTELKLAPKTVTTFLAKKQNQEHFQMI